MSTLNDALGSSIVSAGIEQWAVPELEEEEEGRFAAEGCVLISRRHCQQMGGH